MPIQTAFLFLQAFYPYLFLKNNSSIRNHVHMMLNVQIISWVTKDHNSLTLKKWTILVDFLASLVCTIANSNPGGGALNFFFGGCVPRGFKNVGSRERIFLKKIGVLRTKILKHLGLES